MISAPKPKRLRPALTRLLFNKSMTVAIGTHFSGGVVLCADTRLVDDNGIVSYGSKIRIAEASDGRTFAIAHAANDANAATMLSQDILDALCDSNELYKFEPTIKQCMTKWQADYSQSAVPLLQFILACGCGHQASLYFCQPPNIMIPKRYSESIAIGSAVKIVETLLPFVLMKPGYEETDEPNYSESDAESTLLKMAYLMRRAKSEDLYAGGDTDAAVVWKNGGSAWTRRGEMEAAEEFSKKLDSLFKWSCYGLFSQQSHEQQKDFIKRFEILYLRDVEEANKMWFPSLEGL